MNLTRRLERLEAYLAPPSGIDNSPDLVGQQDRIIEVRGDNTANRRRQPWLPRRGLERWK
jgi:hypothetical protein